MMEKKATQVVNVLFMNIPITLVLCVFAQLLAVWKGDVGSFSFPQFLLNIPVAYMAATFVGMLVPSVKWGMKFAAACKANPGSLRFGLLVNVIVNTVYTLILSIVMTFINVYLLAHAPLIAVVFGVIENFVPIWSVCYIVSFLCNPLCRKLAVKCTGGKRDV